MEKQISTHWARDMKEGAEWQGSLCPADPDNFWIDDVTGERVNAETGERTPVQGW